MPKTKGRLVKLIIFFGSGMLIAGLIFLFSVYRSSVRPGNLPEPVWGVTFSKTYAESFGLDWKEVYIAALDDLSVRAFRIPFYWNDIEPSPGNFNYSDYDWMLKEAEKRNAKIILGVGRKLPRWPECHAPGWVTKLPLREQEKKLTESLRKVVMHFRASPAIMYWQVENEALFPFGICPKHPTDLLKKEVAIVRELDSRSVVITDSGELSTWIRTAPIGDILGISMYRLTWDSFFGYFYFPIPPAYYRNKAAAVSGLTDKVIVTELQAEPWGRLPVNRLPIEEQYQSMDMKRFKSNVEFARNTGLSEIYLWGIEWWYWLKTSENNPEFWNEAKKLWNK